MPSAPDVAIVGGGPAGSATALALTRLDPRRRVALVTREDSAPAHGGETLPPPAQRLLVELGVWEAFLRDAPLAASGTRAAWGGAPLHDHAFVFSPYGRGWHVDRRRFDAMLLGEAARAGVEIIRGDWRTAALDARFIVDATGRRSEVARTRGARHLVVDRLVGVSAHVRIDPAAAPIDHHAVVEACRDGWWYSAPMSTEHLTVTFMTDADRLRRVAWRAPAAWRALVAAAPHTAQRAACGEIVGAPALCAAASQRLDVCGGDGWLAVGDAAGTVDPLSSQGVMRALRSGLIAARVIQQHLSGHPRALTALVDWLTREYDTYLATRAAYYALEPRWPDAPFWRARRSQEGQHHAVHVENQHQDEPDTRWAGAV